MTGEPEEGVPERTSFTVRDVARAAAGDDRAWALMVRQYDGLLRSVAAGFRLSGDEGSDAAQTTWLRLVEHIGSLREPERLAGWLSVTMRRECIRLLGRRRRERPTGDFSWSDARADGGEGIDAGILRAERDAELWRAVDRLPARQRELVLALSATPPPSYAQVGAALSMAVGSIGPTRAKALRSLRHLLAESPGQALVRAS
ncbi:MAG TPA: sigma-70 family RNA polymerase sigma factor [Mycobacteriales bacterium]|jgi:RNA polymerase sigma factor (sigma-70 family)